MSNMPLVTIVLPAYNEADFLEPAITKIIKTLKENGFSFEIIIAEDGSTDGTDKQAATLAQTTPFVKHIHREQRLGRGTALDNAFKQSSGEVLVYMDLDLATDLKYLKPLVQAVSEEGYDLATGSRMLPLSQTQRTIKRRFISQSYNFFVRQMLGSKLKDHQCGFKAFKREAFLELQDEILARHWFWDTEILVRAQRKGYRVKEIAVEWKSGKATKVNFFKDGLSMFRQVIGLWWKLEPS